MSTTTALNTIKESLKQSTAIPIIGNSYFCEVVKGPWTFPFPDCRILVIVISALDNDRIRYYYQRDGDDAKYQNSPFEIEVSKDVWSKMFLAEKTTS